jgi:hypothetical protein
MSHSKSHPSSQSRNVHGGVVGRQRHLIGIVAIDFQNDTHIATENEQGTRVNGARNSGGIWDEDTRCGSP